MGNEALRTDPTIGFSEFEALDFGKNSLDREEGKPVLLKCFSELEGFMNEVRTRSGQYAQAFMVFANFEHAHRRQCCVTLSSILHILKKF